jgi:hypothetical protein
LHPDYPNDVMKKENPREPDALEKELRRLMQKLDNEKTALSKILKKTDKEKQKITPKTS